MDIGPIDVRSSMSGTYTATTTGFVEMRIHNWSEEGNPGKVHNYIDNIRVYPVEPVLEAVNRKMVAADGGVFSFNIDAGPAFANKMYLILQNVSGCTPGFNLNENTVHVPLNFDEWTSMALAMNPYWCNFFGLLDAEGKAYAEMSTFGPVPGAEDISIRLVALLMEDHGFIPRACSNPVYVLFVP